MKTKIATIMICGMTAAAFAQGFVQWQSPVSSIVAQTNTTSWSPFVSSVGSPATAATGLSGGYASMGVLYYQLLTTGGSAAAPTTLSQFGSTLASQWVNTGLTMTNTAASNGRMLPLANQNSAAAPVANWAAGVNQGFMIVGWSANLGTTWSAALANLNNWAAFSQGVSGKAWFGISTTATTASGSSSPGAALFGSGSSALIDGSVLTGTPVQLRPLYVEAVPEPSTLALAGLGGLALLALRRRK